jgi:hypothetical protein
MPWGVFLSLTLHAQRWRTRASVSKTSFHTLEPNNMHVPCKHAAVDGQTEQSEVPNIRGPSALLKPQMLM